MQSNVTCKVGSLFLMFFTYFSFAQEKYTISGYVRDEETLEQLISATVFEVSKSKGATTNTYGFYSLTLDKGEVDIYVSFVGYRSERLAFELKKDTILDFNLNLETTLDEVIVTSDREDEREAEIEQRVQMSQVNISMGFIKKIPMILGESDVLKTLQLLPGVQGGVEGANGIYVRGGSPDQNLILLDGVPIYNTSHFLGILSVFNPDAIKKVTLIKGGFPARYGGRLSSVIEINMKEGNRKKFQVEGSIGILSSRLTLEGPIGGGKTSFIISGRRSYIDLIAKLADQRTSQEKGVEGDFDIYFYDLSAKVNHKFNQKHTIYLSAYLGSDVFQTTTKSTTSRRFSKTSGGLDWGNVITALRWNYVITNKLFANTTLTYSDFGFNTFVEEENKDSQRYKKLDIHYKSGIFDYTGKVDFDFIPSPNHHIRFGLGNTYHTYNPGTLAVAFNLTGQASKRINNQKEYYAHEYFSYVEDNWKLGKLAANIGLHISMFSKETKSYSPFQPRLGLRYLFDKKWSVKASYSQMTQYIHLLSSESIGMPTDLWVPSTREIRPQTSWQSALGVATTLNNKIEMSIEGYYKEMKNVVSYKEGASFFSRGVIEGGTWENKITQGNATAYGMEVLLQKKKGKTTGWIGYTLAWNFRKFNDINSGEEYPFKYDRRHDFEIVVRHKFSNKVHLSGIWTYATGNAISLTEVIYTSFDSNGNWTSVNSIGSKNSYRMPSQHRLDLSLELIKKTRWGERTWIFGVYNAYINANPSFIYLNKNLLTNKNEYRQVSFLPLVPSITFRFKF